ncbi:MAG: hypothetical protein LC730_01570, partial [Acidobacteria bacterium]|nr:hypothetical protein [Acidobacteriota bacterium]
ISRMKADNPIVSEEEFGEIARGFSENSATASSGGRLRGPVRENPNKTEDPYQKLLQMTTGEVTEPVTYQGRVFVLRRGEDVPKSFEEAKKELEVSLRNRRAYTVAAELAQKVSETLKQNKDVEATAKHFAAEANMTPVEMVRETGYVKPGDNVENIGTSPQFEEGIAGLQNQTDVGDKVPIPNGFAIPLLLDQKPPRDAELSEVRDRVVETVKLERARSLLEVIAGKIAEGAPNAAGLASVAASHNLKVQEQKAYTLGTPLGQGASAASTETLEDAIYAMKAGDVTKSAIVTGENYFIVGVTNREEANMEEFAKERNELRESMLQRKRGEVFSDYIASTRRRYEAEGEITIYQEALAKLDEETELPGGEETLTF